jgi:hypothetical protein
VWCTKVLFVSSRRSPIKSRHAEAAAARPFCCIKEEKNWPSTERSEGAEGGGVGERQEEVDEGELIESIELN